MLTSARWINDYLDPPATAEEQADALTRAGFPLEASEEVAAGAESDRRQDFEMTSNRGDAVCHVGLAREIAAVLGRTLKLPAAAPRSIDAPARDAITVTNHEKTLCPLYTGRVIRGVKVGPSPAWLAERLAARGDTPRNNVVDATNFVLFELGQPTHVFDLARLEGAAIVVRMARQGEPFLPIGEGEREVALGAEDLVIADARRAVAIAGVKGGALTAVGPDTTDVLLEAASFDPVTVRNTSRRLGIASDSSYRFERGVHPGQVDAAADRLAALILEIAGGELLDGVVADGAPIPPPRTASMRVDRCRAILGVPVSDEEMIDSLTRLGFRPQRRGDRIECTVPVCRLDVEREIDLIEEVGRVWGHDRIPVTETIEIRVAPPQATELARRAVADELVGLGFVETITHSLINDDGAAPFLEPGARPLRLADGRARGDSVLQPSVLPSLLRVRRLNQDNGVRHLRLFECAPAFWAGSAGGEGSAGGSGHCEVLRHGLLMDVEREQDGLRPIRGVIERLVEMLLGAEAALDVEPDTGAGWLAPGAAASVGGAAVGRFGLLGPSARQAFGLDAPVLVADLDLARFFAAFPPETEAHALPAFPAIERDVSTIVEDAVPWAEIEARVRSLDLDFLEAVLFVTTFRGRQTGPGRKSLTFRLRFRSDERTLTHDEVDPQVESVIAAMEEAFGAVVRK